MPEQPKDREVELISLFKTRRRRSLISKNYRNKTTLNRNQRHKIYNSISRQIENINKINIAVNLSNRKLSVLEASTLNKGLNFCISNNRKASINKDIDKDIKKFTRTLQLRFMINDQSVNKIEKFTGNPNWNPPKSKCSSVFTGYSNYLQQEIKKLVAVNKTKPNISRKERDAL